MIQAVGGQHMAAAATAAGAPGAATPAQTKIVQDDARAFAALMSSPSTVQGTPQTVSTMVDNAVSRALSSLNVNAGDPNSEMGGSMSDSDSIKNDLVTADLYRVSTEKMTALMITTSVASAGTSTFKSVLHNNE